jgi:hypothetical protein
MVHPHLPPCRPLSYLHPTLGAPLIDRLGHASLLRISLAPPAPGLPLHRRAILDILSTCLSPAALLHLPGSHATATVEVRGEATHCPLHNLSESGCLFLCVNKLGDEAKIVKLKLLARIVMVLHTFYHVVWSMEGGGFEVVQRSDCGDIQHSWLDIHFI